MQFNKLAAAVTLATAVSAQTTEKPVNWSTLTPSGGRLGATDFTSSFGIAIQTIKSVAKRDVSQIADGQVQVNTNTAAVTTTTKVATSTVKVTVTSSTSTTTPQVSIITAAAAVSQIGDGQIQAPNTKGETVTTTYKKTVTKSIVNNSKATSTLSPASSLNNSTTFGNFTTLSNSTVYGNSTALGNSTTNGTHVTSADISIEDSSCKNSGTLQLSLKDGVLTDIKGRIGSIVANRQFQFDGPPPQAGAIYAGGWSITTEGNLALGTQDVFYRCLSGTFYNLYDEKIAEQCSPIHLEVVSLIDC